MSRNLNVYPKAVLTGSTWLYSLRIYEHATFTQSVFDHSIITGLVVTDPLIDLKAVFDLVVPLAVIDTQIDDALFKLDIRRGAGPQPVETVWSNFRARAETLITGLTVVDQESFWSAWTDQDTRQTRDDVKRALVDLNGWTITVGTIHQHEGDGSNTVL